MDKRDFYDRVSITVKKSFSLYEADIKFQGRTFTAEGSSSDEAKENLWEYLVSDLGII